MLTWAAARGLVDEVQHALASGAEVNETGVRAPALFRAVEEGHLVIVEILLMAGADPNLPTRRGELPLAVAAQRGHLEIVRMLAESGAEIEARSRGWTALLNASLSGHQEVADELISRGADGSVRYDGRTALEWLAIGGLPGSISHFPTPPSDDSTRLLRAEYKTPQRLAALLGFDAHSLKPAKHNDPELDRWWAEAVAICSNPNRLNEAELACLSAEEFAAKQRQRVNEERRKLRNLRREEKLESHARHNAKS